MAKDYRLIELDELQGMIDSAVELSMDAEPTESPRAELTPPDETGCNWRVCQSALERLPDEVRGAVEIWREQYLLRVSKDLEHRGMLTRVHAILHWDHDAWRYAGTWTHYAAPEGALVTRTPTAFDDPDDALEVAAALARQDIDDFVSLRHAVARTG